MLVAVQIFSPQKPPVKFLYGNVNPKQMTVLETLVQSVDEKRQSRQSDVTEVRKSDVEIEEEEKEEVQLLVNTIDKKLAMAGVNQRLGPDDTWNLLCLLFVYSVINAMNHY